MSVPQLRFATESEDPDVLSVEEAERRLAGAPWRRLVVLGDSVPAGVREAREGYRDLSWIDACGHAVAAAGAIEALGQLARGA